MRGLIYLMGLAGLAGASYGVLQWSTSQQPQSVDTTAAPILTVERLRAVRLSADGVPTDIVEAPRLQQWSGQGGTRIEKPVLDRYLPDGKTLLWHVQADQGWSAADQSTMRLEGAVTLTRAAVNGQLPLTVATRDILVYPVEGYAETAAPVTVTTPGGEIHAIGARVFLHEQQLELLSTVRGTYAAAHPPVTYPTR